MDPNDVIRNIFIWIAVPILGVVVVAAVASGKVRNAAFAGLALLLGAAFVFMPAGTIQSLGTSVAAGLSAFLNR